MINIEYVYSKDLTLKLTRVDMDIETLRNRFAEAKHNNGVLVHDTSHGEYVINPNQVLYYSVTN